MAILLAADMMMQIDEMKTRTRRSCANGVDVEVGLKLSTATMSQFVSHFKFDDDSSIIWSMCVITGCCLVMVSLYFFSLVIQHLYCIPDADYSQTEPRRARRYSFLSVTFATLCVLFTFATYPVCDQLWCGYNLLGFFTFVLVLDSYIFSKFFLYLIFIGRLFNPYYRCIYQYPKWMQYSLQTLLTVMMISVLIGNINNGLHNTSIERMWCAIYVITDLTISIATTFLFFRPIFFDRTKSSIYSNIDLSVVKRYGIVSVLQLLAAVTFELSFLGRIYGGALHALQGVWSSYLDICSVVQMIDCLLLIICIHRGFARKDTV